MSLKSYLKRKSEDAERRDSMRKPNMYRTAYHDFFSGYTEVYEVGKNGRKKIKRIYTGDYYYAELTDKKRTARKTAYIFTILAASVLFLLGGIADSRANSARLVVLFEAVSAAMLFWNWSGVLNLLFSKERLTRYDYKTTSQRIIKSSALSACALAASAVMILLFLIFSHQEKSGVEVRSAGEMLLAGGCMYGMYMAEKKLRYIKIKNETEAPVDGSLIE